MPVPSIEQEKGTVVCHNWVVMQSSIGKILADNNMRPGALTHDFSGALDHFLILQICVGLLR